MGQCTSHGTKHLESFNDFSSADCETQTTEVCGSTARSSLLRRSSSKILGSLKNKSINKIDQAFYELSVKNRNLSVSKKSYPKYIKSLKNKSIGKTRQLIESFFYPKMSIVLKPTVTQTASVIFLHGLGDTGHGWSSCFAEIRKPHIKYIFPTAPVAPVTLNGGFRMNSWFDILGLKPDAPQDEAGIKKSSQILMDLVQQEVQAGIPTNRIFIGGFSQGGATAFYTALTAPHKFAGVIALSTWLPLHHNFPAHVTELESKKQTPILICHGDSDPMVPIDWAKLTHVKLESMGFGNIAFKTYRSMGHSSNEQEMDDVSDFVKVNAQ